MVWTKPASIPALFPNYLWHKLFREISYYDEVGAQVYRQPIAQFMCREWNARHGDDEQISSFDLIFCEERDAEIGDTAGRIMVSKPLVHLDLSDS